MKLPKNSPNFTLSKAALLKPGDIIVYNPHGSDPRIVLPTEDKKQTTNGRIRRDGKIEILEDVELLCAGWEKLWPGESYEVVETYFHGVNPLDQRYIPPFEYGEQEMKQLKDVTITDIYGEPLTNVTIVTNLFPDKRYTNRLFCPLDRSPFKRD
ncbi:hypothetical protein GOV12_06300 [Candidatus Pacearchaeota archaeon]|nr:hypothetical protein [Candidatus Pacearchaeota archaeon]